MESSGVQPPIIRMPELGAGPWLNTARPLTRASLRGRVVLIDFWEFSCLNCVRTLPYLRTWHRRYAERGLTIVGIHAPEFRFGQDRRQVEAAVDALDIPYPILLDNQFETWERFANRAWPTKYLIDARGYIRYRQQGEGGYASLEQALQTLLRERDPGVALPAPMPALRPEDEAGAVCHPTTPELYAGYQTAGFFHTPGLGNPPEYVPDNPLYFELPPPAEREDDRFYLSGFWRLEPEAVVFAGQEHGQMRLNYRGVGVNAVLSWSSDPVALMLGLRRQEPPQIEIRQDGLPLDPSLAGRDVQLDDEGRSIVMVDRPRMYRLVRNRRFGRYTLQLFFRSIGLALYTFTFTTCIRRDNVP